MRILIIFISLGMLSACGESEPSVNSSDVTTDVTSYYFPFKSDPTIYEYHTVTKRLDGSVSNEKSYIKFGVIPYESNTYFIASFDNHKLLTDSVTVIKKSDGFHLRSCSFRDENGGRTIATSTSGMVFPFSRIQDDNFASELMYTTPVMKEMAFGKVSLSTSFKGIVTSPDGNNKTKDCIQLNSVMSVSLKSLETTNHMEFVEKSTVYDKENLGLYQTVSEKADGSVETQTFSKIVNPSTW